jgi:hypothetical protein
MLGVKGVRALVIIDKFHRGEFDIVFSIPHYLALAVTHRRQARPSHSPDFCFVQ